MIHIERPDGSKPQKLIDDAATEHRDADQYYKSDEYKNALKKKSFSHELYKHKDVIEALKTVFNGKCAYCESSVVHIMPFDKEHFRPKNCIDTENGKIQPGYHWLAAEWTNLFLSCIDCNRKRTHELETREKIVIGKLDQFPLFKESKRAKTSRSMRRDESSRKIINPCEEDPEEFFKFSSEGSILPVDDLNGDDLKKAESSMLVYALIRLDLVKKRKKHFINVSRRIVQVERCLRDYLAEGTSERKTELEEALEEMNELQDARESEYIAMTRQLVEKSKDKLQNAINKMNEI